VEDSESEASGRDLRDAVVVEEEGVEAAQQREAVQPSHIVVGQINRVELVLVAAGRSEAATGQWVPTSVAPRFSMMVILLPVG
jgi:hypothetical protein